MLDHPVFLIVAALAILAFLVTSSRWFDRFRLSHVAKVERTPFGMVDVHVDALRVPGARVLSMTMGASSIGLTLVVPFSDSANRLCGIVNQKPLPRSEVSVGIGGCIFASEGHFRECSVVLTANGPTGYEFSFEGGEVTTEEIWQLSDPVEKVTAAHRDHVHALGGSAPAI